jgi:hypothetical protein
VWVLVVLAVGLVVAARASTRRYRRAWAAGLVAIGLAVLADIAPDLAGPAALLVLAALVWYNADELGAGGFLGPVAGRDVAAAAAGGRSGSSSSSGTWAETPRAERGD